MDESILRNVTTREVAGMAPLPIDRRTPREMFLGAISTSTTGSALVDAAIGGLTGYAMAPPNKRIGYTVGGAVATGLAGTLGLVATAAWKILMD